MKPELRRVVTGHDPQGRACIVSDERFAPRPLPSGEASFARLWSTACSPADNTDDFDGALRETGLTCPGGSVLRIVDIPAGRASPLHRTHSLDYGIVLAGAIDLELEDGAHTRLQTGDVIIQRGTIHRWVNRGAATARIAFVLLEAAPVLHRGQALPETH